MNGVVAGIDGSENSLDALRFAAEEAALRNLPLHVVGTYTTPIMSTGYELAVPDPDDLDAAAAKTLEAAVSVVRAEGALEGIDVDVVALEGHAGERLISVSGDATLLVVGSRGHGGFMGLLMGSVTTYVVNHATCPVAVVRHKD
ncbi:MAG: universal stress protein [Microthrixaceae bacterium]